MGRNARQGAALAITLIAVAAIAQIGRCDESAEREVSRDAAAPARGPSSSRPAPALPDTRQGEAPTQTRASHSRFAGPDGGAAGEPMPPASELRALVRSSLEAALARRDPPVRLSDDDLDELTQSALRIRRARQRLRELPRERGAGPELRRARRDLELEAERFEVIAGVSLIELTAGDTPRPARGAEPVLETADEAAEDTRDRGRRAPPPRVRDAGAGRR